MRQSSLAPAQVDIAELNPLAGLVFGLHEPVPGAGLRVPSKRGVKRAVRIFKDEGNGLIHAFAIAERFRGAPAKNIDPVCDIALAGVVVAYKDQRFARALSGRRRT